MFTNTTVFVVVLFVSGVLLRRNHDLTMPQTGTLTQPGRIAALIGAAVHLLLAHLLHLAWWLVLLELAILWLGQSLRWVIRPTRAQLERYGRKKARRSLALRSLIPAVTIVAVLVWKLFLTNMLSATVSSVRNPSILPLIALPAFLIAGLVSGFVRGRPKPRNPWTAAALFALWLPLLLGWLHELSHTTAVLLIAIAVALSVVATVSALRDADRKAS